MSKGLEALERLVGSKVFISLGRTPGKQQFANDIYIIETELKELEDLQKVLDDFGIHNTMNLIDTLKIIQFLEKRNADNSKKLKALEIIKNKRVNLEYLKCCDTYEQYKTICSYWNEITEQEFDLLKEVLL